ncbi:MAG: hypothetical protein LUH42_05510, partial [Oscillospiraceae bacterium]|nr:hypothetical protein [Oscillospiraceae bacterium]
MKKFWRTTFAVLVLLSMVLTLGGGAVAAETEQKEIQTWSGGAIVSSSYSAPNGTALAFIPEAEITGDTAAVDIYVDGELYEDIEVTNYASLLALAEDSGLNGKKAVTLVGVIEYDSFDAASGTVALYDAIGPNDNVLYIPDAETEQAVAEVFQSVFNYGTEDGVSAYYTFDQGYGLYVDGYYAETTADCAYYGISDDGTLTVLDGPVNALYTTSALAAAGFAADYSLAAVSRNEDGKVNAVYYTNCTAGADTTTVQLGLDGNATVDNEATETYGIYLDYDFNGFTAAADIAETAIYLYTGAAVGTDEDGNQAEAYADGSLNTYTPVTIESIIADEDGIIRYADGSYEYEYGKAV